MKISELIEELEVLKVEHGDLIVIAADEEGKYEIGNTHADTYNTQLAIRLCP